ncbi:TPA: restriction endonuclease subunit S [Campylobacter coli]|uniref:restriction endonuclease subunit S n=1 Tax=Campylobacter coli TaxID=195 RepID=UPI0012702AF0|nr:restriction endonuclease subunit S [Campylobacter coli]EAJ7840712.1 restriction endonuclease subunit S [Campylobacter jejuni]EAJ4639310.1 restriction endonuclease subunit S [Campylobacter coli]EAJ4639697.1 restriction endonuclease subunit S [Campylobacter coli]EAJ7296287.1 restriction endonuclease subunit S [Campylobacter coli]
MTNLPQGWKMETLGEILSSDKYSIKRGPFGSALKKSFFVEKGIRIFEQYNPINNDPHWKRYFISHEKFQELEAFKATEGDLLISCSGTLGKIVELPKDTEMGIINQALLKIRLNNIKILNSYFIYYFNSPIMQEKILESTLGSAIKNIASVKILKQIEIPLPPLKEQERIVGILDFAFSKIDENIKKAKENLANIDELMQSALQKAFNPLNDNTKENYQLPQSWEWKSLEEISENISAGGDKPKNCTESKTAKNQIPVYANGVNNNGLVGYTDKATIIKPSLTISARGTIGFVCIRKEPYFPIVRLISLIPCENILCLHYLYFCLNFFIAKGEGSSIPQLTIPKFKSLQIPLPPLKEQEQIAKHLDFVFEKTKALKELYTKELKDYEELKQSLLNKAFKGEL